MARPREVTDEQILVAARCCFLARGANVTAAEIARELGVSHTTLFNRFGSKEGLMVAALGPPSDVPWVAALDAGPDERPLRVQLIAHAKVMSSYFQDLHAGFGVLQAAGIDPGKAHRACRETSGPVRAYEAFVAWIERAQRAGRLGPCDANTLASTVLSALQGWAFTQRVCGHAPSAPANDDYVERLVELLFCGVGEPAGAKTK